MIGWIICDGVHWQSSVRKVTHRSTILGLGGLTSRVPMGTRFKFLGLSHSRTYIDVYMHIQESEVL